MKFRTYVIVFFLLVVALAVLAARSYPEHSGIAVSVVYAALYVVLYSIKLPLERWAQIDRLESVMSRKKDAIYLHDPCPESDAINKRHVHFDEILSLTTGEELCRTHGSMHLTKKFVRDVQSAWLVGVAVTIVALVVWGALAFTKPNSTTPPSAPAVASASRDFSKASSTIILGSFPLASSALTLLWFRKQNT